MNKNNANVFGSDLPSVEALERIDRRSRAAARTNSQRRALTAAKVRAIFSQSYAQYYMTFQEFRSQGTRNKILKGYGREPMYLPHEGKDN